MEFTGRIMKVLEARKGISEKTGNEWQTQGFIFEYFENPTDRYSDKVYLETFDTKIMDQLEEGMNVRIGFGHHVRDYTTKDGKRIVINEIRLYKFEPQEMKKPAPEPEQPQAPAPQTEQPQQEGGDDGLPF